MQKPVALNFYHLIFMENMKKIIAASMAFLCLTTNTMAVTTEKKTISLRIIETSDVHGHFFPYDFIERKPLKGTLARVNTYVNTLRKEYGSNLLLLDNGDILQGQPTCYYTNYVKTDEPNIAARLINYMQYDASTIGNHDIETGHQVYDKWIHEVQCPMLGANIIDKETGKPYVRPYVLFEREGVKIAVLGMITPTIPFWLNESMWSGLEFQEMASCAKYWVNHIKEVERADLIIGLFHSGYNGGITTPECNENSSEQIAREVPGFDIVFFGHDHIVHNEWIENVKGDSVLCLDPSCFAKNVADARIELTYEDGRLAKKRIEGDIHSVEDEKIDDQLVKHFQQDINEVKKYVERKIGYIDSSIDARDCFFGSAPFTDLIHNIQLKLTGADISFNAPFATNTIIEKGSICMSDLFKLYRYENKIYVLQMTGEEIRNHLEMSYDQWVNTMKKPSDHIMNIRKGARGSRPENFGFAGMTFNFDSAAGIEYEVDVTKPDGEKVHVLRMSNGDPFDDQKTYKVVMNSYRGNGGGELLTKGAGISREELEKRIIYKSERDQRYYIMQEIEKEGHIVPKANNNWRFIPEEWTKPALIRDRKLIFDE